MHRATYCAIARSTHCPKMRELKCTGRPTAPIITRYRCFLPDLAGLAGLRRVGPGTETSLPLQPPPSLASYSLLPCKTCPRHPLCYYPNSQAHAPALLFADFLLAATTGILRQKRLHFPDVCK